MQCTWNAGACIIITFMGKKFHFSIRTTVLLRVSHFSDIKIQPEYVLAGLHLEIDPGGGGGGGGGGEISICRKEGGGGKALCTFAQAHVH